MMTKKLSKLLQKRSVDVVTLEFENIDAKAVEIVSKKVPVYPKVDVLKICQNRAREKSFSAPSRCRWLIRCSKECRCYGKSCRRLAHLAS